MLHKSAHFSTLGSSSRNGTAVQAALLAHKYDIQQQYRFKSDGKCTCMSLTVLGIRDTAKNDVIILKPVLGVRIRGIRKFLGLLDLDPLVRGTDPDPSLL
jgi:hypothetical protein